MPCLSVSDSAAASDASSALQCIVHLQTSLLCHLPLWSHLPPAFSQHPLAAGTSTVILRCSTMSCLVHSASPWHPPHCQPSAALPHLLAVLLHLSLPLSTHHHTQPPFCLYCTGMLHGIVPYTYLLILDLSFISVTLYIRPCLQADPYPFLFGS